MHIADSMKNVLKNKSHIFTDYWKEDVASILKEVADEVSYLITSGKNSVHHFKNQEIKASVKEILNSAADGLLILKILPGRIFNGFTYFKEDLLEELERQADQKQKAVFSIKVIGALTTFTASTVYNVRKGKLDVSFKGMKQTNAFTRFVVGEIIFKLTRLLLLRFLSEVEKDLTSREDLQSLHYFRNLLAERNQLNDLDQDPAIEIVENLKKYIMTGKRGIE
jgi:hypothetical protein